MPLTFNTQAPQLKAAQPPARPVEVPGVPTMPWDGAGILPPQFQIPQTTPSVGAIPQTPQAARGVIGTIRDTAQKYGVPVNIALAVARQESAYRQEAMSPTGGVGIFGVLPDQASAMGLNAEKWKENIEAGVRLLSQSYQKTGGWRQALHQTYGGALPTNLNASQIQFAQGVARGTGLALPVVYAWLINEQPASTDPAGHGYNWLNIGPGQMFGSNQSAIAATTSLINTSGYYAGIRAAAKSGNMDDQARAIQDSPWDLAHYGHSKIEGTLPQYQNTGPGDLQQIMMSVRAIRSGAYKPAGGSTGVFQISAPLPGNPQVTSGFGPRTDPFGGGAGDFHNGVDLAAPQGTPIHAMIGGKVIFSGYTAGSGNTLIIKDGAGYQWNYFHMVKPSPVAKGTKVKAGDMIGQVGSTGESTGPHLDIHLMVNGQWVNPMAVIKKAYAVGFGKTGKTNIAAYDLAAPAAGGVNGSGTPVGGAGSVPGVGGPENTVQGLPAADLQGTLDAAITPGAAGNMPSTAAAWQRILDSGPSSPETKNLAARAGVMTQQDSPDLAQQYTGALMG